MTERAARPSMPVLVALAGQQNCGKSTIFNMLTGLRQHIANYPGVTVDRMSGDYLREGRRFDVVDLPGCYGLTAFSPEERVARDFLLQDRPDVVVNVVDATQLRRGLPLTFQLREMGFRVVLALNMMDAAASRGLSIDVAALARRLDAPVVPLVGRRSEGEAALRAAIAEAADAGPATPATLNYGPLEDAATELHVRLAGEPRTNDALARWRAVRLLEGDAGAEAEIARLVPEPSALFAEAATLRAAFEARHGLSAGDHVSATRDRRAAEIVAACVVDARAGETPLSERIDRVLLHPFLAPLFLLATIWIVYQLSIVQSSELIEVAWPLLAEFRDLAADLLPDAGFLVDPQLRALGLWLVDSVNTLLNYVPIFLILFALIAILEDSGYMARIAFILDRVLHRFGLHGQSTLPFILAGVFAGGCAVPGVAATKGIPDARARLATILTVPFMNCMAKIPLYTLLIGIYFADSKGLMLFYLSTITVIAALLVAKLLTASVLAREPTAPFVMELPSYRLPTLAGVLRRSFDRTWSYVQKVGTVVVALAVVIYLLLQFPGVPAERMTLHETRAAEAIAAFRSALEGGPHAAAVAEPARLIRLIDIGTAYEAARRDAGGPEAAEALDAALARAHPDFAPFVLPSRDPEARAAFDALRELTAARNALRRALRQDRIEASFLGRIGRAMEPVTRHADFDWKTNIALLASFAARESAVSTLGALFDQEEGENLTLEQRMGAQQRADGRTAVSAVALMLFFALYTPCLATVIMVRVQTGSTGWMMFSIVFPTLLGLGVATAVFQGGTALGLSGLQTMTGVWFGALGLLLVVALPKPWLPALARRRDPVEASG